MNIDTSFFIFQNVFYYFWMIAWMKNVNKNKKFNFRVLLSICQIFFANFSLPLLIKVLLIKKGCTTKKLKRYEATLFYKQLGSGLTPQSCLYFQRF